MKAGYSTDTKTDQFLIRIKVLFSKFTTNPSVKLQCGCLCSVLDLLQTTVEILDATLTIAA